MTIHRKISGFVSDGNYVRTANIEVRFTSDERGETLSLQMGNIMIAVPYEPVKALIKKERGKA
jgi:hypothetical protein